MVLSIFKSEFLKLINDYIQNFLKRAGGYILIATIISRFSSFLASWFAIQFIPHKELGVVLFSYNIILFVIPFADFGLHQSLIRYGALLKNEKEKNSLFVYVFQKGFLIAAGSTITIICVGLLYPFEFQNTGFYLALLSLHLIPLFIMELIKIQFRLIHQNKQFSLIEMSYNCILLIFVICLSFYFKEIGYIIAIIVVPLLTILFFIKKLNINTFQKVQLDITNFKFWKYGFYSGLTSVVSNMLFIIDIFLISYLLKDAELVTSYKYVSIIPISIIFLPRMFMAADFVTYTENIKTKKYIFKYIKSYMLLFTLISIFFVGFFYYFSNEALALFNDDFSKYSNSFVALIIGICGILIFRGLFGNLLCSIGKIEVNYYLASIAILINITANYYLIPKYGIFGAAITTASLMWFTGIFSCICFFYLYKKFLNE